MKNVSAKEHKKTEVRDKIKKKKIKKKKVSAFSPWKKKRNVVRRRRKKE